MDRRQAAVYRACFMRRRVTSAAASCSPATGPYRAHDTGCAGRHAGSPYQGQGPIELMGRCGERPLLGGRALPSMALPSVACGHARGALRRPKVLRGPPPRACSCCGWRQFDFPFGASMCLLSRFPSLSMYVLFCRSCRSFAWLLCVLSSFSLPCPCRRPRRRLRSAASRLRLPDRRLRQRFRRLLSLLRLGRRRYLRRSRRLRSIRQCLLLRWCRRLRRLRRSRRHRSS